MALTLEEQAAVRAAVHELPPLTDDQIETLAFLIADLSDEAAAA